MESTTIYIIAAGAFGLLAGMIITAIADSRIIRELKNRSFDTRAEVVEIKNNNTEDDPFKPF